MKKGISLLLVLVLAFGLFTVASFAEVKEGDKGFYNIGTAGSLTIVPKNGEGAVAGETVEISGSEVTFYPGADRLAVTYSAAISGNYYMVWLVQGSELPTVETADSVYYVNQATAAGTSVEFNVYPKEIASDMDMTLFITSDALETPVKVALSYGTYTTAPAFVKADINKDGKVDAKDVTLLRRYLSDKEKYPLDAQQLLAANINEDAKVDAKDVTLLRRYLSDKVKYPLP